MTIGTEGGGSVSDSLGDRSTTKDQVEVCILPPEVAFVTHDNTLSSSQSETNVDLASLKDLPHPKGKSIAHHYLKDKGAVFFPLILRLEGNIVASSNFQPRIFVLRILTPKLTWSQEVLSSTSKLSLSMVPWGVKT